MFERDEEILDQLVVLAAGLMFQRSAGVAPVSNLFSRRSGLIHWKKLETGATPVLRHFGFNCGDRITSRMLSCPRSIMHSRCFSSVLHKISGEDYWANQPHPQGAAEASTKH